MYISLESIKEMSKMFVSRRETREQGVRGGGTVLFKILKKPFMEV